MATLSFLGRLFIGAVFALILSVVVSEHVVALPKKPKSTVADLRYGSALYHYYQNRHLQALSDLLVASERGGIQGHGDNPELMAGGFYLAYGLEKTASEIFERLLEANRPEKTRNAAWYYLARLHYRRNDWKSAYDALSNIGEHPSKILRHDMRVLKINLLLKQDKPEQALELFDKPTRLSASAHYIYFNLGAAYSRNEDYDNAVLFFSQLRELEKRTPELIALHDKAMTAAGYAQILNKKYSSALTYFSQVRLDSPLSNQALLGYGWAYYQQEEFLNALKPWQVLSRRLVIDEYTQEALVAIPTIFEKLERPGLALQHYRDAQANFETELLTLNSVIGDLANKDLLDALEVDRSDDINWLSYARSNHLSPQISYLIALFSREGFLAAVQELRDLLVLQQQLEQWEVKMKFYSAMLAERAINRRADMTRIEKEDYKAALQKLEQRHNTSQRHLNKIKRTSDYLAFTQGGEQDLKQRINRAQSNLAFLQNEGDPLEEKQDRLRFISGRHLWQGAEDFSQKVWQMQKAINHTSRSLEQSRKVQSHVQNIVGIDFDLEPYRNEIGQAQLRVAAQKQQVDTAVIVLQDKLRKQVVDILLLQKKRINHYLARSRLAIARLLDSATGEAY